LFTFLNILDKLNLITSKKYIIFKFIYIKTLYFRKTPKSHPLPWWISIFICGKNRRTTL